MTIENGTCIFMPGPPPETLEDVRQYIRTLEYDFKVPLSQAEQREQEEPVDEEAFGKLTPAEVEYLDRVIGLAISLDEGFGGIVRIHEDEDSLEYPPDVEVEIIFPHQLEPPASLAQPA